MTVTSQMNESSFAVHSHQLFESEGPLTCYSGEAHIKTESRPPKILPPSIEKNSVLLMVNDRLALSKKSSLANLFADLRSP